MKGLLSAITLLLCITSFAQVPQWIPSEPDSVNISVLRNGVVNQVKIGQLTRNKVSLSKHTTDSAALKNAITTLQNTVVNKTKFTTDSATLRGLINSNTSNISSLQTSTFPITGGTITGTAGAGYMGLIPQSSNPSTPASGVRLFARSTGAFSWLGTNGFVRTFLGTGITADRDYTLPDGSGTLSLNELAQTFTASKSFATGTDLSIYNTADPTTNYERARFNFTSNVFRIETENGGTGTSRVIRITAGGRQLDINNAGSFLGYVNASSTIGGTAANGLFSASGTLNTTANSASGIVIAPTITQTSTAGYRGLWISPYEQATGSGSKLLIDAGTNSAANGAGTHTSKFSVDNTGAVTMTGTLTASGDLIAGTSGEIRVSAKGRLGFSADGIAQLRDAAGSSFNRLAFGGTTNAFPALKRSGTTLNVRLADDSGDAGFSAATITVNSTIQGSLPFPRMTEAQRTAISSPAVGLHVYQTDAGTNGEGVYVNKSTGWIKAY